MDQPIKTPIEIAQVDVLSEILAFSGVDILKRASEIKPGEDDTELGEYMSKLIFGIAALFVPENKAVVLPEGWSLDKIGENVRAEAESMIKAMDPEEAEKMKEPSDLVPLGVMAFFSHLLALMENWGEQHKETDPKKVFEGFIADPMFTVVCFDWAYTFLGDYAREDDDGAMEDATDKTTMKPSIN